MMNKLTYIDLAELKEIANGDLDFMKQVAREFKMVAEESIADMKTGLEQRDYQKTRTAVHRIRPNYKYLGMEDQQDEASQIMDFIDGNAEDLIIINMVKSLIKDTEMALKELEEIQNEWLT